MVCAFFFLVAPGLTLVTITAIAGAAFLVSGVFDIINYVRFHKIMNLSGWAIAYAVLDIVIGLMFLIHPLALAGVIPWMIGAFFIIFGVFEIVGSFTVKKLSLIHISHGQGRELRFGPVRGGRAVPGGAVLQVVRQARCV